MCSVGTQTEEENFQDFTEVDKEIAEILDKMSRGGELDFSDIDDDNDDNETVKRRDGGEGSVPVKKRKFVNIEITDTEL